MERRRQILPRGVTKPAEEEELEEESIDAGSAMIGDVDVDELELAGDAVVEQLPERLVVEVTLVYGDLDDVWLKLLAHAADAEALTLAVADRRDEEGGSEVESGGERGFHVHFLLAEVG